MGWQKCQGPTDGEGTPRLFYLEEILKVLSVHVDESGDFGKYSTKYAPQYIFTLVFHDQKNDISDNIKTLDMEMANLGFFSHVVHCGPLIRKEEMYCNLNPNERRAIFNKIFFFTKKAPISYKTFVVEKKEFPDKTSLELRIKVLLERFIDTHIEYFLTFDKIVLYYDNGQNELGKCLYDVFTEKTDAFERRLDAKPYKYKLLQVADMLCTLKLLELKAEHNKLSRSEIAVFHTARDLRIDFIKKI